MPTKLYLCADGTLSTVMPVGSGTSASWASQNTTGFGTSPLEFVSEPIAAGLTLQTTGGIVAVTGAAIWGSESSNQANAYAAFQLYRRRTGQADIVLTVGETNSSAGLLCVPFGTSELATTAARRAGPADTAANTSLKNTALLVGDRIVLKLSPSYYSGRTGNTVTLYYGGAEGSRGESYITLADNLPFGPAQTWTTETGGSTTIGLRGDTAAAGSVALRGSVVGTAPGTAALLGTVLASSVGSVYVDTNAARYSQSTEGSAILLFRGLSESVGGAALKELGLSASAAGSAEIIDLLALGDAIDALFAALPEPRIPGAYPVWNGSGYEYWTASKFIDQIRSDAPIAGQTYYLSVN